MTKENRPEVDSVLSRIDAASLKLPNNAREGGLRTGQGGGEGICDNAG